MKKIIFFLFIFTIGCASTNNIKKESIRWYNLDEGMRLARELNRPCVVDFHFPDGCPRCDKLEKYVYSNRKIIYKLNTEFIPIRINLAKKLTPEEEALGKRFKYGNECMLLFMDSSGKIIKDPWGKNLCFVDYIEPEWFLKYLDMAKKKTSM